MSIEVDYVRWETRALVEALMDSDTINWRRAYTIGHTRSYDEALEKDPDNAFKLGKTEDYQGGCVFKTLKEALEFLESSHFHDINWGDGKPRDPKNFSVYGLHLVNGYEDISEFDPVAKHHYLLIDSKFSKLPDYSYLTRPLSSILSELNSNETNR